MVPEASNAANLGDFSLETFANGLFFSGDDFGGEGGRLPGADSSIGLLGIGGALCGCQTGGKIDGLNQIGKKMRTWLGSGTTPLVNGMETLMTKVN